MAVKPVPEGYATVTAYLTIRGAAKALEFYKAAFGAKELYHLPGPDGTIAHGEIQIGDSRVMFADENPQWGNKGPQTLGGTPVGFCVYVDGVDAAFEKAVAAGATVVKPVQDQFYGDRSGTVLDPFGHQWMLATHIEDVSPEEMNRRMQEMMKAMPSG